MATAKIENELGDRVGNMEYTLILPVRFFRTGANQFACESAFARHLVELKQGLPPQFTALRVCGPAMSTQEFASVDAHAGRIDEVATGVFLTELYPGAARTREFWLRHFFPSFRKLWRTIKASRLVHSGPSTNIFQPIEITALLIATLKKCKTIAVVDIDVRNDSRRARTLGMIGRVRYLAERLLFDPLRSLQFWWIARYCSLVLLKGKALVDDYGRGKQSVKNFFDTAHSDEHIIPCARLEEKAARLRQSDNPAKLVYFGRLATRKGVDRCIRSVAHARTQLGAHISFTIIGDGPDKEALTALSEQLGMQEYVTFLKPMEYGANLFQALYGFDILLAAPLTEDTPRSAFDAMAAGMAICAYDTEYYRTLQQLGPTVTTSPWISVDGMAAAIAKLSGDRDRLIGAQHAGRQIAIDNTQERWINTRVQWTREFCLEAGR